MQTIAMEGSVDRQAFSSFMKTQPNLERTTGFICFDLQTKRPEFPESKAHEQRFDNLDHFPKALSSTKQVQQVYFNKQLPRNNALYSARMSDGLTTTKHLNLIKPKAQGILHFGVSRI